MEFDDRYRYFDIIDSNNDNRSWGLYNYAGDRPYGKCAYMLFPMTVSQADDWLITRAVKLEKGKYYCVSVYAGQYLDSEDDTSQVFEVKVGSHNDAAGMKYSVFPATKVTSKDMIRCDGWFVPQFTATYYVGVHVISPLYQNYYNYLSIDNIAVDAPKEGTEPNLVTDVTMTNVPNGTTAVEIALTAPSVALDGSALKELTQIIIKRGDEVVKILENPEPGKRYTVIPDAESEYNITAVNASGEGARFNERHIASISSPESPVITSFREVDEGIVHMEWTAPTKDVSGNAINPDKVTYTVIDNGDNGIVYVAEGISDTEVTYDTEVAPGEQRMAIFTLSAILNDKASQEVVSGFLPVGTPYALPYRNSFTLDDYYNYIMTMDVKEDVVWRMLDDHSDPHAQDNDNGYIYA